MLNAHGKNVAGPRILVVTKRMDTGGTERHLARTLPGLKALGIAIELFVLERGGSLEDCLAAEGILIVGPFRRFGRGMHLVVASLRLLLHVRRTRPDVLHFFLPEAYLIGSLVATILGHPVCFMSRRSLTHYHRSHPWLGRLERMVHRRTAVLLGNSQAVVEELIEESGDRDKVALIHNGIGIQPQADANTRLRRRAALAIPEDAFVLIVVANLIAYKGHKDLLQALGEIDLKLPQPWRLIVLGRDEGAESQCKSLAAQLGLSDRILWLGERSDVEQVLPIADLGLLVSHQEGFSNALIETMGQGIPVIATAIGGNLDAVVDGQSGRLVPVADPARLGEVILDVAWNPAQREAMGLAARERVIAMFSQTSCISRYERLYLGFRSLDGKSVSDIIDGEHRVVARSAD